MKERILDRHRPLEVEVLLEGIGRIEVVRRLHERDLLVLDEPADGGRQKVAGRHVVAVEDHDEFAVRDPEGVIDVPGLGVVVLFALDVANAHRLGEFAEGVAASVVEEINLEFFRGPVEVQGRKDGGLDDFERLVVGRDEDVDRGPDRAVGGERIGLAVQDPADLEVAEDRHDEGVEFGREQKDREEEFRGRRGLQRRRAAPPEVAGRHHDRNHEEHHQRHAGADVREAPRGNQHDRKEDHLTAKVKGLRDAEDGKPDRKHRGRSDENRLQALFRARDGVRAVFAPVFAQGPDTREPAAPDGADFLAQGPHGRRHARDEAGERVFASKALPVEGVDDEEKHRLQRHAHHVGHGRTLEIDVQIELFAVFADVSPIAALKRHEKPGQKQPEAVQEKRKRPRTRIRPFGDAARKVFSDRMDRRGEHVGGPCRCRRSRDGENKNRPKARETPGPSLSFQVREL